MAYTLRNKVGSDPDLETSESGICPTWNKGGQAGLQQLAAGTSLAGHIPWRVIEPSIFHGP